MKCKNYLCVGHNAEMQDCRGLIPRDIIYCEHRKTFNRITRNPVAGIDIMFREERDKYFKKVVK